MSRSNPTTRAWSGHPVTVGGPIGRRRSGKVGVTGAWDPARHDHEDEPEDPRRPPVRRVRRRAPPLARPLPRLRRLGHAGRGGGGAGAAHGRPERRHTAADRRRRRRRGAAARHGHRRARPRARRRVHARLHHAARRRAGHRQVHVAAAGARPPRRRRAHVPARRRRGVAAAGARCAPTRLGVLEPGLWLVAEASLPHVVAHVESVRPDVARGRLHPDVARSRSPGHAGFGHPGARVLRRGSCGSPRNTAMATILVGHVTKDGSLAGPRALEHVVDTVLLVRGRPPPRPAVPARARSTDSARPTSSACSR